jgi:drug/metabolite transporter (DMT)-like permease
VNAPSPLRGVLRFAVATAVLALMDVCAKHLGATMAAEQIAWSRYFGQTVAMLAIFAPRRGWALLSTGRPWLHLWRSLLMLACTLLFFNAIRIMPLADAVAISFLSPLLLVALAALLLKERVGVRRWSAVAVGFLGAMIIVRPGAGVANWGAALVLVMCVTYALYLVATRVAATAGEDNIVSLFYSGLIGTLALSLWTPFVWSAPANAFDGALFAALGLFGGVGHYLIILAYRDAEAAALAPLNYLSLVWAVAFGLLAFGDFPDGPTLLGAAIVAGAGIYVIARERRLKASQPA